MPIGNLLLNVLNCFPAYFVSRAAGVVVATAATAATAAAAATVAAAATAAAATATAAAATATAAAATAAAEATVGAEAAAAAAEQDLLPDSPSHALPTRPMCSGLCTAADHRPSGSLRSAWQLYSVLDLGSFPPSPTHTHTHHPLLHPAQPRHPLPGRRFPSPARQRTARP
jgi:hypothetical protein